MKLKLVLHKIRNTVPVGFNHHQKAKDLNKMPDPIGGYFYNDLIEPASFQLGTLGGGNHFIELQKNLEGELCVMIHSGSRNIGFKVANHYNALAKTMNDRYFSSVPKGWDLAFLPLDSDDGQCYLGEMDYCVKFAQANRMEMMSACVEAISEVFDSPTFYTVINIPHNYARMEHHFGQNVMVHRKGSTSAKFGEVGLIPGSQGTKSYIVSGKGDKESFTSCSHGAGRKMGRSAARKTLNMQDEIDRLNSIGVIHAIRSENDLDEAPGSYKDIDVVMAEQADLVDVIDELTPLAVIKA